VQLLLLLQTVTVATRKDCSPQLAAHAGWRALPSCESRPAVNFHAKSCMASHISRLAATTGYDGSVSYRWLQIMAASVSEVAVAVGPVPLPGRLPRLVWHLVLAGPRGCAERLRREYIAWRAAVHRHIDPPVQTWLELLTRLAFQPLFSRVCLRSRSSGSAMASQSASGKGLARGDGLSRLRYAFMYSNALKATILARCNSLA
jgi:hypothetical protein